MKKLTKKQLNKILDLHKKWLHKKKGGKRADLSGANLSHLSLSSVNLKGACLFGCNFTGSNLRQANLEDADLYSANLTYANLSYANLKRADLFWAKLHMANLYQADLRKAKLGLVNLDTCININNIISNFQIPQGKDLIGWKKIEKGTLVKLKIPKEAKRTGCLISDKCRAEYAEVLEIIGEGRRSMHDKNFVYKVGKIVKPDSYKDDIRHACQPGIHFFMTKKAAKNYWS